MNLHLHHVIRAITGETGQTILDAIVRGERALRGDWREEHLFTLRQSLEAWRNHQGLAADCEKEMIRRMAVFSARSEVEPPKPTKRNNQPNEPMRKRRFEKFGVDLTSVDGISIQTALTF